MTTSQGSSSALCEAHYFVGLAHLAQGDRVTAKQHFQAGLDTGDDWYVCWGFSRLLLKRLETNPNWPPTIPLITTGTASVRDQTKELPK